MPPAVPWTQHAQFALFWITTRRAAVCTGKSWAKGHHGIEGLETHCAISPARQNPEVVDFAVQLQPVGNREVEERRGTEGVTQQLPHKALGIHKATSMSLSMSWGKSSQEESWDMDGGEKGAAAISTHASLGPPWLRSKTCRGLRYHMKDWMILAPCEEKKDFR